MNDGRGLSPPNLITSESSPPVATKVRDNEIKKKKKRTQTKQEHVLPSVFEEEKE